MKEFLLAGVCRPQKTCGAAVKTAPHPEGD